VQKTESIAQLTEALSKAQGQITGAVKDAANPFFKSQYADLQSVWDAIRSPLSANGLAVIQLPGRDEQGLFVETILAHSTGEWISGMLRMTPVKDDPQGIGSAITYARRYALQAIAGVAPMDDDGEGAMGRTHPKKREEADVSRQEKREREAANSSKELQGWRDVECTSGKQNGPLRGKKLGDLNPDSLKYLSDMFLVEGKEIKPPDRKMAAALAMWQAEAQPKPSQATNFDHYNGPNHKKLAELLVWESPEIAQEYFLRAMKDAKHIPAEAKSFSAMSDETAKKFVDDFEDVKEIVRQWIAKKENPAS
jgi:hypothetical protein